MLRHTFLSSLILLTACPDPTETPSADGSAQVTTAPSNANTPSAAGGFESDPNEARVDCATSECVTVSGTFNTSEDTTGTFRVDVQKVTQGSAPRLVHTLELQSGGDFSFELPKDFGNIVITGFVDQTGDGPTPDDAQGRTTLEVKAESVTGLSLDVALGNAPPPPPQPNADGQADQGSPTPADGTPENSPPSDGSPNTPPQDGTAADGTPTST